MSTRLDEYMSEDRLKAQLSNGYYVETTLQMLKGFNNDEHWENTIGRFLGIKYSKKKRAYFVMFNYYAFKHFNDEEHWKIARDSDISFLRLGAYEYFDDFSEFAMESIRDILRTLLFIEFINEHIDETLELWYEDIRKICLSMLDKQKELTK